MSSAFSRMSRIRLLRLVFRFGCACSKRVSRAVIQAFRSATLPLRVVSASDWVSSGVKNVPLRFGSFCAGSP